jgi:hypothetical protein
MAEGIKTIIKTATSSASSSPPEGASMVLRAS